MKNTPAAIKAKFDEQNLEAARIIAADQLKFPGGMGDWAAMILNRAQREQAEKQNNDTTTIC